MSIVTFAFFTDRWQGRFDKKDRFIASNPPVLIDCEKSYINEQRLHVVWQGSQFVYHSLALVNREMCRRLLQIGHELSVVPYEPDEFVAEPGSPLAAIQECVNRPLSQPADVVVRHQWPPDFTPPACRALGDDPALGIRKYSAVVDRTYE